MENWKRTNPIDIGRSVPVNISATSFNLSDLAGQDPEELMGEASPAMRAALNRLFSSEIRETPGGFNSFIDPDL